MKKNKFICPNGSVFTSEEELNQYIIQHYFQEVTKGAETIIEAVKKAFPDKEVWVEEGKGWYATYRIFTQKGKTTIETRFGDRYTNDVQEVLQDLKEKWKTVEYVVQEVNKLGSFYEFYCSEYDYRYGKEEEHYRFEIHFQENEDYPTTEEYYPNNENELSLEEFIHNFNGYFLTEVEGEVQIMNDHDGYYEEYAINGISIGKMISRGKKVRLSIVEE